MSRMRAFSACWGLNWFSSVSPDTSSGPVMAWLKNSEIEKNVESLVYPHGDFFKGAQTPQPVIFEME